MNKIEGLKERVERLRQDVVGILDELLGKTLQFDLAQHSKDVEEARQKVVANSYNVLVAGEANRGKSSFINALIGRDLLPVDVEIATSQIFRVSQAEQDAFRLRFADGTWQPISAAELEEFGSQAAVERQRAAGMDFDTLRWIEVEVPLPFLPAGVSILDTPGLGALYAAHAQITQRFVPLADAVIFVLDSSGPMVRLDISFVETILGVTKDIFFIQTKIDQYDPSHWRLIQQRHQEILTEHFQGRLRDLRVWPISNRNLLQAADEQAQGEDATGLIRLSRKPELVEALEIFLFRVAGLTRCSDALLLADHSFITLRKTLASRLAVLEAASTQQLVDAQQESAKRLQQFTQEWGPQGVKRRELYERVQQLAMASKMSMRDLLDEGGQLKQGLRLKITALKSTEEANRLAAAITGEVATTTATKWRTLSEVARLHCSNFLVPLMEASEALLFVPDEPTIPPYQEPPVTIRSEWLQRVSALPVDFVNAGTTALTLIYIASFFYPPLWGAALIGTVVGGIFGMVRNWQTSHGEQLTDMRTKLEAYLDTVMNGARKQFLEPDVTYDGASLVTYHFNALVAAVKARVEQIVAEKSAEAEREGQRRTAQLALDSQQRAAQQAVLQQQLTEWDQLGSVIRKTNTQMMELEQELTPKHN